MRPTGIVGEKDGEDRSRQRKEKGGEKWSSGKREDARECLQHQGLEPHHGETDFTGELGSSLVVN